MPPAPQQGQSSIPALPHGLPTPRVNPRAARVLTLTFAFAVGVGVATFTVSGGLAYGMLVPVGLLVGINLYTLLAFLLARPSGLAALYVSVGGGRWLGSTTVAGRLVVFRMVPVLLLNACLVATDRAGLRMRWWAWAVVRLLVQLAVCAALVAAGGPAAMVGWGAVAGTVLLYALSPTKVTSAGWQVFRLASPAAEEQLAEWRCDEATVTGAQALGRGRIDQVREILRAAPPSGSPQRQALRISLALAERRPAEAAHEAVALAARSHAPTLRRGALQFYAYAVSDGVTYGLWPRDEALPHFSGALAALRAEFGVAALRGTDLGAREALFGGRPDRAAAVATLAAAMSPEAFSRAIALTTLSVAHASAGQTPAATRAADRAAALLRF